MERAFARRLARMRSGCSHSFGRDRVSHESHAGPKVAKPPEFGEGAGLKTPGAAFASKPTIPARFPAMRHPRRLRWDGERHFSFYGTAFAVPSPFRKIEGAEKNEK